jgi:integral membrane sensor domain MASE1
MKGPLIDRAGRGTPRGTLVAVMEAVLVGALYYVTARFSLRVALVGSSVTPVWPPSGIALVGLLVFGRRVLPGIYVAALAVNLPLNPPAWTAFVIAVGNAVAPLVAFEILQLMGFDTRLGRLRDAVALVAVALLGMTVSATIGTTVLHLAHAGGHDYAATWSVWWTGDAMGILVFTPFLLVLLRVHIGPKLTWSRAAEAVVLLTGSGVVSAVVFRNHLQLLFLVFPFLIWAAWRFEQFGAAPVTLIVTVIAVWAAVNGVGPFAHGSLLDNMIKLQTFNGTVALTAFFLGAVTTERAQALSEESAFRSREAESNRRRALELNDEVVQGLSVAKYAFDSGEMSMAQRAVSHTLEAARQIVSELLSVSDGTTIEPGDLVRERPAVIGRSAGDPYL